MSESNDNNEEQTLSAEEIEALKQEVEAAKKDAASNKERLEEASKQLMDPDYLEYLGAKRAGDTSGRRRRQAEDDEGGTPSKDLEEMTNTELVSFVVGSLRKDFAKVGDVIDDEFSKVNVAIADMKTAREIDRVATANPDFWEHKDEIYALAKKNPHLSPTEAYKIVKGEKLSVKEKEAAAAADKRGKRAGSERPGGRVAPGSTKSPKPQTFADAFDDAYATAFGDDE